MAVHKTTIELDLEQVTKLTEWFRQQDDGSGFFLVAEPLIGKSKMTVYAWTGDDAPRVRDAIRAAGKITKPFRDHVKAQA